MKYSIFLTWNGTVVMQGKCSAVMAYETLRQFGDNFVNQSKAGYIVPPLRTLVDAAKGDHFACNAFDGTSMASFQLVALEG